MFSVYVARNRINGKCYVGVTGDWPRRKIVHLARAAAGSRTCPRFYDAIRKYGPMNFSWKVHAVFAIREFAYHHEYILAKEIGSYNAVAGGNIASASAGWNKRPVICLENGRVFESIQAAAKEFNCNPPHIRGACIGKLRSCHGRHFQFFTETMNEQDRMRSIRIIDGLASGRRQRVSVTAYKPPNKRRPASGKPVICLDTGIIYDSADAAAEAVGADRGSVSRACRYVRQVKQAKGFHFAYVSDVGQRMFA